MVALGRGVKEAQLKSGIERLVDLSGGRALFVERSDQLDEPFAEILEELSNQYIIGYESTNAKRNGSWREVKLEIPGTRLQRARAPGLSRAGVVMRCVTCSHRRVPSRSPAPSRSLAAAAQPRSNRRSCRGRPSRPRPSSCSSTSTSSIATRKPVPTLTAGRLRAAGQRPAAPDRVGAVHLDGADQHHAGHAARNRVHARTRRATTGRLLLFVVDEGNLRVGVVARGPAHRAVAVRSAGARRPGRPGAPARPASAASSSPPIASASPTRLMRVTGSGRAPASA